MGGFTDLHTKNYEQILYGNGFRITEVKPSIQLVHDIRHSKLDGLTGHHHELAELALNKHPFEKK